MVCTILGDGVSAFRGEGATPDQVSLYWPIDLVFDAEGRLLVLDWNNIRVRRIDHDGRVRTVLGTGFEVDTLFNGTPALETSLHHAFSMCFDGGGRLYLAGFHASVVLRMDPDNRVWSVAGAFDQGYSGDGGPAVDATLGSPAGIAVAAAGSPIYVADTFNHCIRAIDAQGLIWTIAGQGPDSAGYGGDGGPATSARLHEPYRIRLDEAGGNLYISDSLNHRIRCIDLATGIITTVAGNGTAGFSGDGGPATQASLRQPFDARIGPDGLLYIADTENHRIRRVDANGIITTIVGSGVQGTRQDALTEAPALAVNLYNPAGIVFSPEGDLLIADFGASVVRRVRLEIP